MTSCSAHHGSLSCPNRLKKGTCFFELVPSPAHDWFLFVALISKWTGRAFDQVPVTSLPVILIDRK
jgi:hypothetical protein